MKTVGAKINKFHSLREKKRELEAKVKEVADQMSELEMELIYQMEAEGIAKASGKHATVSISESVKPRVEDWDVFYKYIRRKNWFHLLERRPHVTACRELFEKNHGKIPGVVPFTYRRLNMRNL